MEFLTDEQVAGYGCFAGEPPRPELERFFYLDDADRNLIERRRFLNPNERRGGAQLGQRGRAGP